MTAQHRAGAANFTRFTVAFGVGSTATSFTLANRDRPKDTEFLKDLSYELSMSFIMSKIGARIMSNPTGGVTRRYLLSNGTSSLVGGIDAVIFANMYSLSTREAEERLERIKNSPQQVAALQQLDRYMQEEGTLEKIENSIMAQFRQSLESPETRDYFLEEGVEIGDGSVTGPLHISDLDDPEKAARIKRAVMMQFYNEHKGAAGTGTVLGDKFTYDRAYNAAVGIPRAMVAGYATYAALCRNAATPVRGLTQAFAIQALNQGLGGYLYYHYRKEYVGR
jgi:hypothetical protein